MEDLAIRPLVDLYIAHILGTMDTASASATALSLHVEKFGPFPSSFDFSGVIH
jgi:hypothetical protein